MKRLVLCAILSLAFLNIPVDTRIIRQKSSYDFSWRSRKVPGSTMKTHNPEQSALSSKTRKISRRERCCILGKEVAKIGETCTYAANPEHIGRNSHYHMMKTSVWMRHSHPIKLRSLQKCKPYKSLYEKCCKYESSLITRDIQEARRKIKKYFRKARKNSVREGEGSSDDSQGGRPSERSGISAHKTGEEYIP